MGVVLTYRKRRSRAFTLIEMLAVMAIIAMMMGIGIYSFVGYKEDAAIRTSTLNFKSGVANARQWAITHRHKAYLLYGNTEDSILGTRGYYVVTMTNNPDAVAVSRTNWLAEGVVFASDTNCTRELIGHEDQLYFKIDGAVNGEMLPINVTLAEREKLLRNPEDSKLTATTIQVLPLTGMSRIRDTVE